MQEKIDRSSPGQPALFTRAEFERRRERLRSLADQAGLSGVVVWSRGGGTYDHAGHVYWLSGYYPQFPIIGNRLPQWSGRGHGVVVLPVAGEPRLIVDVPYHRPDLLAIDDVRQASDVLGAVVQALNDSGMTRGKVGIAGENVLPWFWQEHVRSQLPEIEWQGADALTDRAKRVKSPTEQQHLRRVGRVATEATEAMRALVEPGRNEGEIVGAALATLARHGAVLINVGLSSGQYAHTYSQARMPGWDPGRVLSAGEMLRFDMVGQLEGYLFDIARTGIAGGVPSEAQRWLVDGARDTVRSVIAAIRPGVTAGELAAIGQETLAGARFQALVDRAGAGRSSGFSGFGHALGTTTEEPWLTPDDPTVIEPGMVLAIEKTVGIPGIGGASWEENLIVTDTGVEILTNDPHPWID